MGFYHLPGGGHIQGHPQGIKASVDQALQSQAPAPVIQEGTAAYYRVDWVGGAVDVGLGEELCKIYIYYISSIYLIHAYMLCIYALFASHHLK